MQTPFQDAPLDLDFCPLFYLNRRAAVDARLAKVRTASSPRLVALVGDAWLANAHTVCRGMNWDRSSVRRLQVPRALLFLWLRGGDGLLAWRLKRALASLPLQRLREVVWSSRVSCSSARLALAVPRPRSLSRSVLLAPICEQLRSGDDPAGRGRG